MLRSCAHPRIVPIYGVCLRVRPCQWHCKIACGRALPGAGHLTWHAGACLRVNATALCFSYLLAECWQVVCRAI